MFVDTTNRLLYFTNEDSATVDGATYSWHHIEVVDLDGGNRRRTVVTEGLQLPRGLWADPQTQYVVCLLVSNCTFDRLFYRLSHS